MDTGEVRQQPWADWPTIMQTARANGWRVLAERGGEARLERRDGRSSTGAVSLHIKFDGDGAISGAKLVELGYFIGSVAPQKLDTILGWLRG
jgi:hypothetical protein